MSNWARRQLYVKRKKEVSECGYNFEDNCTNEDIGFYGLKCPFNFLNECPVHNEELS